MDTLADDVPADGSLADSAPAGGALAEQDAGPTEALPDAGPPPRFCQTVPSTTFCNDFEEDLDGDFTWTEALGMQDPPGLARVDDGAQPGAYSFQSSLVGSGMQESARLVFRFPSKPAEVHVEFDFLPQRLTVASEDTVIWLKLQQESDVGTYPGVGLSVKESEVVLFIDNQLEGTERTSVERPLPQLPGGWVHITMDVSLGASGSVSVRYNDEPPVLELAGIRTESVSTVSTYVAVGLFARPTTAYSVLYDNVFIDYSL